MLLITAASVYFFTYFKKDDSKKNVSYTDAIIIGFGSGSSYTSRYFKVRLYNFYGSTFKCEQRESDKGFSFLMVLVPIFGILILKSIKGFSEISGTSNLILFDSSYIVGFFSALLSGVFACKVMLLK